MKLFFRKLHKWISLAIGLQVLAWLVSGLVIALLDPAKVNGQKWARPVQHEPSTIPQGPTVEPYELPSQHLEGALAITLGEQGGLAVYRVLRADTQVMLDASDGTLITFGAEQARNIALSDFAGNGEVVSVTTGLAPDRETRNHQGGYWRIDFSDAAHTSIYVSAATGEIWERRNRHWRVHDFFWMLHIMDYGEREDFNNPLIIGVALVAAWLGISGVVLLFSSFRRRDFRFLSSRA